MHFLNLLGGTLLLRPYVFLFLACYLVLAAWQLGLGRTLAFLAVGYLVSWLAELCSIHTGFPFGVYIYIPATVNRELWVAGVPFMDSLSYVFMAFASYSLALLALSPGRWQGWRFFQDDGPLLRSWRTTILGGVLMMTLDVVVDPLALRGYRWFLGQIYGYPSPGAYFGIPLSQFRGLARGVPGPRPGAAGPPGLPAPRGLLGLGPPGLSRPGLPGPRLFTSASWPSTWP